jgi:hypothetical protein
MAQGTSATGALDALALHVYTLTFRDRYRTAEGDLFQDLFVRIMERAHPLDFCKVQPWGPKGDLKCDGYLKSQRTVFACYGPKEFKPMPRALEKVSGDHGGAAKNWKAHMSCWTLVHNDHHGLPAELQRLLLDLAKNEPEVSISEWGEVVLETKIRSLAREDLLALFGDVPTARDFSAVRQADLQKVLPALTGALAAAPLSAEVRPVPPDKIEYNQLSDSARALIVQGMHVSERVRDFFRRWDPLVGERIIAGFRDHYRDLRQGDSLSPDDVLWKLYEFAGHNQAGSPREQAAIFAVVSFLFESCEIFERPPGAATTA